MLLISVIIEKNINTIVSNGERFIAYEIVQRLKEQCNIEILLQLADAVTKSDKDKGKIHQVFKKSFNCMEKLRTAILLLFEHTKNSAGTCIITSYFSTPFFIL